MDSGVSLLEYKGKKIIVINFDGCYEGDLASFLKITEQAKKIIRQQPLESALTLTNVAHAHYNVETLEELKKYVVHNKPYVKKAAVIGLEGLKRIAYNAISIFSRRHLMGFGSEKEALNWLIAEE